MYHVHCPVSGDRADADDLAAALAAAATLVDDYAGHVRIQGAFRAAQRSILITRDGRYDGLATTMAQAGNR